MPEPRGQLLFEQIVRVAEPYLGPAAERFVARQVQNHLGKEPDDLAVEDLDKLIDWIKASLSVLTEDHKIIDDFAANMRQLSRKRRRTEK